MANKDTVEKVRSLLEGHCYGPLREAAEKWLETADEKYAVKEKAGKAWDKLNEAADKYADASAKFNETMTGVSDKAAELAEKISDNAGPAKDKIGDAAEKIAELELVKQLKEGICSVGEVIETFSSKEAKDKFGEDLAGKIKAHAEELKAKGEEFCDCDACVKAREILKDLGEDISTKTAEIKDKAKSAAEAAPAEGAPEAAEEAEAPAESE
jgi:gas vesicle protein